MGGGLRVGHSGYSRPVSGCWICSEKGGSYSNDAHIGAFFARSGNEERLQRLKQSEMPYVAEGREDWSAMCMRGAGPRERKPCVGPDVGLT